MGEPAETGSGHGTESGQCPPIGSGTEHSCGQSHGERLDSHDPTNLHSAQPQCAQGSDASAAAATRKSCADSHNHNQGHAQDHCQEASHDRVENGVAVLPTISVLGTESNYLDQAWCLDVGTENCSELMRLSKTLCMNCPDNAVTVKEVTDHRIVLDQLSQIR
ncbi:hypothetical protein AERO9AM_10310 [Aeromicrobium sp. 9AM]|nr:hypothetical protein AERO9AM_10310 [Aeromicrobium sp. 9AM]